MGREGFERLPRYSQTLAEQNVTGEKWLLYVTRNFEPPNPPNIKSS